MDVIGFSSPFIQHLGYKDLLNVAFFSKERRLVLFKDSSALYWQQIRDNCCSLIDSITLQINLLLNFWIQQEEEAGKDDVNVL
jgi:hypothetical protein